MSRPTGAQDVHIFSIQNRSSRAEARKPRIVRWRVDGRDHSQAFRTKAEADRLRSRLLVAQQDGERFDRQSGRPLSWTPRGGDTPLHVWARRWVAEQWPEWAPRTRNEDVYSLSRLIPHVIRPGAAPAPVGLRTYLRDSLRPIGEIDADGACERWLSRWVLTLAELDRPTLAEVSRQLGIGAKGQVLANETARRYRRVAHSCIRRAVELEQIPNDPWPPTPRGRSRRKANQSKKAVDVRELPNPSAVVRIIDAMKSHQPGSHTYQAMTAVVAYAGLRPSEVVMLRPRALSLPSTGWGSIAVTEADVAWDEPGDPKTGSRTTPVPPRLVELLRRWIESYGLADDELLFRTRCGNHRPGPTGPEPSSGPSANAEHHRIRVYDLRHAHATAMIKARVPLAEAARRLGHSVETLVSTYIGAMDGDDVEGNILMDAALATTRDRIVVQDSPARHSAPTAQSSEGG